MIITQYPNNEVVINISRAGRHKMPPKKKEAREGIIRHKCIPRGWVLLDIRSELSQNSSECTETEARKRHPLRKKARHRIMHLASMMSKEGRDRTVFLTGTLPGSTDEAIAAFNSEAGYVRKIVQTYLPRYSGIDSSSLDYLYVWEHQKRGALHMHMAVRCETIRDAQVVLFAWQKVWREALVLTAKRTGVDIFAREKGGTWRDSPEIWQVDSQTVKKDVGRYLSKYLSKGGDGACHGFPPRWWGASVSLRAELRQWLGNNSLASGLVIKAYAARNDIRSLLDGILIKMGSVFSMDISSKFQDSTLAVMGYVKDGVNVREIYSAVKGLGRRLGLLENNKGRIEVLANKDDRISRLAAEYRRILPVWLRRNIWISSGAQGKYKNIEEMMRCRYGILDLAAAYCYESDDTIFHPSVCSHPCDKLWFGIRDLERDECTRRIKEGTKVD
jgi:hypothetical protein